MNFKYYAVDKNGKARARPHRGRRRVYREKRDKEQGALSRVAQGDVGGPGEEETLPLLLRHQAEAPRAACAPACLAPEGRRPALPGPHHHHEPARRGQGKGDRRLPARRGEGRRPPFGGPQGIPGDLRYLLHLLGGGRREDGRPRLDPQIPGGPFGEPGHGKVEDQGGPRLSRSHVLRRRRACSSF